MTPDEPQYEYAAANHRNLDAQEIARICNAYAEEGWELVGVTAGGISGALLTFKRSKEKRAQHPEGT